MRDCNPDGPLLIYISKMIPSLDGSRFLAFGRVFSGTARVGHKVRIMGPNYLNSKNEEVFEKSMIKLSIMMGKNE